MSAGCVGGRDLCLALKGEAYEMYMIMACEQYLDQMPNSCHKTPVQNDV